MWIDTALLVSFVRVDGQVAPPSLPRLSVSYHEAIRGIVSWKLMKNFGFFSLRIRCFLLYLFTFSLLQIDYDCGLIL